MKKTFYFLMSAALFCFNYVIGQGFPNVNVNNITEGTQNTDGGNTIAVFGSNVYLLWGDYGSTFYSYISKSTDGGATFGEGVKVGGNDPHLFGSITVDDAGIIYAVWDGVEGENINGVYFAKSTDHAASFSSLLTISGSGVFPLVSVHGNNVYIFFCMMKDDNHVGYFFARSTDGGNTFAVPYEISGSSASVTADDIVWDSPNSMCLDNDGNIYCIWNEGRRTGIGTDIYFAKSTDNGANFSAGVMVNDILGSPDKRRTGPKVGVHGSNVYTVWRQEDDNQGNNRKILYSKSSDGGATFGNEVEMALGGWGSPALSVNSTGELYVAYPQYSDSQNGIFCSKSVDNGITFPVTVFINDQNADSKNLSICVDASNILYAAWTDNRTGDENICFAKGTINLTDIDENSNIIPDQFELLQNYPNPFNPSTIITYKMPVSGNVSIKIYDMLGNEIVQLINEYKPAGIYEIKFNGNDMPSGVYLCRFLSGYFSDVRKLMLVK